MMILLYIVVALVVLVLCLVVVAAAQPSEYRVIRSAVMSAPPSEVFAQVNDFHKWALVRRLPSRRNGPGLRWDFALVWRRHGRRWP